MSRSALEAFLARRAYLKHANTTKHLNHKHLKKWHFRANYVKADNRVDYSVEYSVKYSMEYSLVPNWSAGFFKVKYEGPTLFHGIFHGIYSTYKVTWPDTKIQQTKKKSEKVKKRVNISKLLQNFCTLVASGIRWDREWIKLRK
jgi:hypothetical protein